MLLSNSRFVLALLAIFSFRNFLLVSVDGKCAIEPDDVGHVDWPSKKKKIKKHAFKKCKELRTICIPPEVESIHNTAFYKSGLDLTELQNCDADPSTLFYFEGPFQLENAERGELIGVLVDPPIDYILSFTIEQKGIHSGPDSGKSIIRVVGNDSDRFGFLRVVFSYETTKLTIVTGDGASSSDYHYIWDSALEIDTEYEIAVGVLGMTSTVSVNGVVKSTKSTGTRQKFDKASIFIGGYGDYDKAAIATISNIRFDKQVSSVFNFKGPLQIEKSVEGEPAAVLAAPPTDYFLQFNIELKSISGSWDSIITLTAGGEASPDYLYGQLVPGVQVYPGTSNIIATYGDEECGSQGMLSQQLELNKKSTVLIKVYQTTATISVNGVIEGTGTVGIRSQLNNVELYIGDPWSTPANAIVSDISFGLV